MTSFLCGIHEFRRGTDVIDHIFLKKVEKSNKKCIVNCYVDFSTNLYTTLQWLGTTKRNFVGIFCSLIRSYLEIVSILLISMIYSPIYIAATMTTTSELLTQPPYTATIKDDGQVVTNTTTLIGMILFLFFLFYFTNKHYLQFCVHCNDNNSIWPTHSTALHNHHHNNLIQVKTNAAIDVTEATSKLPGCHCSLASLLAISIHVTCLDVHKQTQDKNYIFIDIKQ